LLVEVIDAETGVELGLRDRDEIGVVRFAATRRLARISTLDVRNRKLRSDLRSLEEALVPATSHEVHLDHAQSVLALSAMRWLVDHDRYKPKYLVSSWNHLLDQVDGRAHAA